MKRNLFFDFMEAMETAKEGLQVWKGETFDVECPGEETSNEWLEAVTDEQYAALKKDETK